MDYPSYSTAFEKLVDLDNVDDDIVGLLAYAYYKRDKRDITRNGDMSEEELARHHRTLTSRLVQQYQDSALLRLEQYANAVLDRSRPQIEEETRVGAIQSSEDRIISGIRAANIWWHNIVWNVLAWLISLAISFLVLSFSGAVTINIG